MPLEDVAGVAGDEDRRQSGAALAEPLAKRGPGDPGHDHIGDEKVDLAPFDLGQRQGGLARSGRAHPIAFAHEKAAHPFDDRRVVVADEDARGGCGRLAGPPCRIGGHAVGLGAFRGALGSRDRGQVDPELGAASRLARDLDASPRLADDAKHGREAEPGAAIDILRGEERFEDPLADLGRHSLSAVADAEQRPAPRRHPIRKGRVVPRIEGDHRDLQMPAVRHRVAGVDGEIEEHLLELDRVRLHQVDPPRRIDLDHDRRAHRLLQQRPVREHQGERVHKTADAIALPAELQKAPGQAARLLLGPLDQAKVRLHRLGGAALRDSRSQQVDPAGDDHQAVVEVVGHAAGHAAKRLHLLGLAELLLALLQVDLRAEHERRDPQGVHFDRLPRLLDGARVESDEAPPAAACVDRLHEDRLDPLHREELLLGGGEILDVADDRTARAHQRGPAVEALLLEIDRLQHLVVDLRLCARRHPLVALPEQGLLGGASEDLEDVDPIDPSRPAEDRERPIDRFAPLRCREQLLGGLAHAGEDRVASRQEFPLRRPCARGGGRHGRAICELGLGMHPLIVMRRPPCTARDWR